MALDLKRVPITRVTITGREFVFPKSCCCCGQPADRQVSVSATKNIPLVVATIRRTLAVSVPACALCGPRIAWESHGGFLGLIPKAIGCLVGSALLGCIITLPAALVLGLALDLVGVPSAARARVGAVARWLPVVLAAAVYLVWLAWELRKRPKAHVGPGHVCELGAVYIKRFDAQGVTLNFLSETAALEFADLNPGKVAKLEASTLGDEIKRFS